MKQGLNLRRPCLVILTCFLLLFPTSVLAAVYYVDITNGTDDGSHGGSPGTGAWKTLHYAVGGITSGDELNVAAGTYSTANGEDDAALTVSHSGIIIQGDGAELSIVSGVSATVWFGGISVSASNVTIRDLAVRGFINGEGIGLGSGTGSIIEGCNIHGNQHGIGIIPSSSGNIIRNGCKIYDNSYEGILIDGSNGNEIYGNRVYDNGWTPTGIKIQSGAANNLIHHNNIYSTDPLYQKTGISFDGAGSGNEVYENNLHGHETRAIYVTHCSPTIRKNRIYDNYEGIRVEEGTTEASPTITNNLIYATGVDTMAYGVYIDVSSGTASPKIYHNTIDGGTLDGIHIFEDVGTAAPDIKYNIITNFDDSGIENEVGYEGSPVIDYNNVWNNAGGNYSNCTPLPHNISVNPLYASYELQPTSPCIDAIPLNVGDPLTDDIDGNPRPQDSGYDMGAYEHPVTISESVPVPPGIEVEDYMMVSFTVEPDDPDCTVVFGPEMGGDYEPDDYRFGTYDPTLDGGGYLECSSGLVIVPGRAYWAIARDGVDLTIDGIPASLNDTEVALLYNAGNGNGWNQIGSPNKNYQWGDIQVLDGGTVIGTVSSLSVDNEWIDKRLWRWDSGSYYADTTVMVQGEGYWVQARKANVSLRFRQSVQLAQVSNTSIMFADLWNRTKRWAKKWVIGPRAVVAYSNDSPPMPMASLSNATDTPGSTDGGGGGGGGCFVDTSVGVPMGQ